ncbi:electron transfer flavoprotein subunit alpha/FixB family protein [Schaalia sp. ZJ1691]|uniref:electron transfer flavoprotein subunit alpha/FixB family protein n=1 Tax=Schaalia sp. ZJ1691 TaxID=2709404 RepID=UPI0013EDEA65|nr:electron transfer flavoprotein subunit alpha/FixB family protein [Schaalia sp. ZJ1691]
MTQKITQPILVLVDHESTPQGINLTTSSAQVITAARSLTTGGVDVVAFGELDTQTLGRLGVRRALQPQVPADRTRVSAVVADGVDCALSRDSYGALLLASTYRGREVASRIAALHDWGAVVDATAVEYVDETFVVDQSALAGSWSTRVSIVSGTPIIALRPSVYDAQDAQTPTQVEHVEIELSLSPEAARVEVISSGRHDEDGRVSLTEASTVVVGGRGVDGDFGLVEQLADVLGGAVGATRVATDEGWVPRTAQIGQTGVAISPNLYIGLGVSGAIHHTVGMQSSAHIVAVCDDPDAPIFEIADFGVVGDLNEVVPQAIEALSKAHQAQ